MKSKFGEQFNHNAQALAYDKEVKNENNPIREGYQNVLSWIKKESPVEGVVIELGSGTGNTTAVLSDNLSKIFCVDISSKMIEVAKEKIGSNKKISFTESDLLSFLSAYQKNDVSAVVSMYAIHHLTREEKHKLFQLSHSILKNKGKVVFADLMFKDKEHEQEMRSKYPNLKEDFDEEFWWHIDEEKKST